MTRLLFISDLHLDAARPHVLSLFEQFCQGPAARADALYILGDLFEAWAGDDVDDPVAKRAAGAIAGLTGAGTTVRMLHGNRDFLLGPAFAERCGMELLPDPTCVSWEGRRMVLCHGDSLCTGDADYQALRSTLRDPAVKAALLARPRSEREDLARRAREASQAANANKPDMIMDVTPAAVDALLDSEGAGLLIHGHTHRPDEHVWQHGQETRRRIVLGDWDQGTRFAQAHASDVQLLSYP